LEQRLLFGMYPDVINSPGDERDGAFSAWEMKWNPKTKTRFAAAFIEKYQPVQLEMIHRDNFETFLDI
jgi:hypothetical protein